MAKKGGIGPNRDKKATVYILTLPDGREVEKRDYNLDTEHPLGCAYLDVPTQEWRAVCVVDNTDTDAKQYMCHYYFVPARKK